MITVPEATRTIIKRSRYLSEAISKNLINFSSLARYIKPEIEEMLLKKVSDSSIIMALKRIKGDFQPGYKEHSLFNNPPPLHLQSGLCLFTFKNTIDLSALPLLALLQENDNISILCSLSHYDSLRKRLPSSHTFHAPVSSLTIYLPDESIQTPGVLYFFIKSLAWEGINILQIFSNQEKLILVLSDEDAQKAFSIVKSLFN